VTPLAHPDDDGGDDILTIKDAPITFSTDWLKAHQHVCFNDEQLKINPYFALFRSIR